MHARHAQGQRGTVGTTLPSLLPLMAAIALVAVGVFTTRTTRTTRARFEAELHPRAMLATNSVRQDVLRAYTGCDMERLLLLLDALVHDDQVLGAALCRTDGIPSG